MRQPYTLLIVDDEPLTRHGLRHALHWEMLNIQIVGEARDGLEALSMAIDLNPDIILCDVRMPRMDGIALATALTARKIGTQFLFISGYSNREYLKSAIQLGAIDFLDKPFQISELLSAVERAKQKCDSLASTAHTRSDMALLLVNEECPDTAALPFAHNRPVFSLVLRLESRTSDSFATAHAAIAPPDPADIENYLHRLFGSHYLLSPVKDGYVAHASLPEGLADSSELLPQLELLCENVQLPISCIGVGKPVDTASCLHDSYVTAYAASVNAFFYSEKAISYLQLSQKEYAPDPTAARSLIDALEKADFAHATETLETLIDTMCTSRYQDIPLIKDELAHISLSLALQIGPSAENGVAQSIQLAPNILWIKQYILKQMEKILDLHNLLDDKGRLVFATEQYILHHLEEDLSVNTIARNVFVTPTYLCYIYKKNTGRTIGHYIQDMRMKKAARLLLSTSMRISDVARAVGFANPNYFAKLFARQFGATPSDYREHRL